MKRTPSRVALRQHWATVFIPKIVGMLHGAGWHRVSVNYEEGPVVKVFAHVVEALAGDFVEVTTLGRVLRQIQAKKKSKTRQVSRGGNLLLGDGRE